MEIARHFVAGKNPEQIGFVSMIYKREILLFSFRTTDESNLRRGYADDHLYSRYSLARDDTKRN